MQTVVLFSIVITAGYVEFSTFKPIVYLKNTLADM